MAVVSSSTREEEKAEGGEKIQKLKYLHCLKVFIYFLFLPFSIIHPNTSRHVHKHSPPQSFLSCLSKPCTRSAFTWSSSFGSSHAFSVSPL